MLNKTVYGIGTDGEYIGTGKPGDFKKWTAIAPPLSQAVDDFYIKEIDGWQPAVAVDGDGVYIAKANCTESNVRIVLAPELLPNTYAMRYAQANHEWIYF